MAPSFLNFHVHEKSLKLFKWLLYTHTHTHTYRHAYIHRGTHRYPNTHITCTLSYFAFSKHPPLFFRPRLCIYDSLSLSLSPFFSPCVYVCVSLCVGVVCKPVLGCGGERTILESSHNQLL